MICGRCGHLTASHSTYCPYDRWTLFQDAPEGDPRAAQELASLQLPRGMGGLLSRRRDEGHRSKLEKFVRSTLDARYESLEQRAEREPQNAEVQRELGIVSMLDENWQRATAHFERAHRLLPHDLQISINYAVALAHRGKWQPALDLLNDARTRAPHNPQLLLNIALCSVHARRPEAALEAVNALEALWRQNADVAHEYHDDAQTARGLALLQFQKFYEARVAFEAAARHTSAPVQEAAKPVASTPSRPPQAGEEGSNTIAFQTIDEEGRVGEAAVDGDMSPVESQSVSEQYNVAQDALVQQIMHEGGETSADLLVNLSVVEAMMGDVPRALGRLVAALRMEPGHPYALNNLGVLSYQQNQLGAALRFLDLAQQIQEASGTVEPAILNHLGVVQSAAGHFAEGLENLSRASGYEAAEFEVFYNTGRAFIEHGRPDKGVENLRQAFAVNPNHPDVHTVLGAAYLFRGRAELTAQAMNHLRRALQLNPAHRIALADITLVFRESNQDDHARKALEQGIKSNPRSPELMVLLGLLVMSNGDTVSWGRAAEILMQASALHGGLPAAIYNAGLCQFLMGLREGAGKMLEEVTHRDPSFAPAYFLIGVGHAEAKRFDEALAAWKQAEKYEPGNADLQANLGFLYYRRADYQNAIKHYMAAHRAAPHEAILLVALGLAYARSNIEKALERAIDAFQRALQIEETMPVTHMNLGLAYYIHNRPDLSVPHWRRVSQLDIDYYKRMEELEAETGKRTYDDTFIQMRPLNWRARIIGVAPLLPRPHTQLLPGENARAYRTAIPDPQLLKVQEARRELKRLDRALAWANTK